MSAERALREPYPAEQRYPRNQWYVAAFSDEVGRVPIVRELLDTPVLLYRTVAGEPVALYDRCPHRGLPLSMGKVIGDRVQCGYHGMEFGPDGACVRIPSQDALPSAMRTRSFPLIERWRWLWIWMGEPVLADPALIPDHDWLGVTRKGYYPTPFFMLEADANYQYPHDNLLDSTHVSFLHTGTLDSGDEMASAKVTIEERDQLLRISYDTPNTRFPPGVADYFRVESGKSYDRILINETFAPSLSIGKQAIRDPANPDAPPIELYAINAITPASVRKTYIFHAQITSFDPGWRAEDIEAVKDIVIQDIVATEAMQRRYDRFGDCTEISIRPDNMGIRSRRVIQSLLRLEAETTS